MKVAVMEPMEEIRTIDIEPDESGSYLKPLQGLVGGLIEPVDVLYGDQPLLWVNDNGIAEGLMPSRTVYANERMEKMGYLSMMDMETPVKKGDLYTILYGPIVACSYDVDDQGERILRDISDEELCQLEEDFWDSHSGINTSLKFWLINQMRKGA